MPDINLGEILSHFCFKYFFCSFLPFFSFRCAHYLCVTFRGCPTIHGYSVLFVFVFVFLIRCFSSLLLSFEGSVALRPSSESRLGRAQGTDKPRRGVLPPGPVQGSGPLALLPGPFPGLQPLLPSPSVLAGCLLYPLEPLEC